MVYYKPGIDKESGAGFMPEEIQALIIQAEGVAAAVGGLFALANCFFGYRLQKLWIALIGFFIGLILGFGIGVALLHLNAGLAFLIGAVLGVLLGLVAFKVYRVGVFLMCFGAVYTMCYSLIPLQWAGVAVGIAGGILAGVLAVKYLRPVIILTTGVGYGLSAAQMLLSLFGVDAFSVILPVGGVLALAGILVQFKTTPAKE